MDYSFLQNFTSLIEVITAIYVSMILDNIFDNIWTPKYKQKISKLIDNMKIPAIKYFIKKVEDNIDANTGEMKKYMKAKALFFVAFCLSLLLLAGLEKNSPVLQNYGYVIVNTLSLTVLMIIILGRWIFNKYSFVAILTMLYTIWFGFLCFSDLHSALSSLSIFSYAGYTVTTALLFLSLSIPIVWQICLIWIYSSLYKGFMKAKISLEAYKYGKAFLAYKLNNMAALPKEYEMVARDFVNNKPKQGDVSLAPLNNILVAHLEDLCEPPKAITILLSWAKFNLHGRHNKEMEYIEKNGLDYESFYISYQVEAPIEASNLTDRQE